MAAVVTFAETFTLPMNLRELFDVVESMVMQCSQLNINAYDVEVTFTEQAGWSDPRPGESSPGTVTLTAAVTLRKD